MPKCTDKHCQGVTGHAQSPCHQDGMKGKPVYVEEPKGSGKWCYCICSCLAHKTPVAIPDDKWAEIQKITRGDKVLVLNEKREWVDETVVYSDGTPPMSVGSRPMIYLKFDSSGKEIELLVTEEHPFLLPTYELQAADRLAVGMEVLDEELKPAKIIAFARGRYSGGIHNVSTVSPYEGGQNDDIWGHLINTAGIISGDFYAQQHLIPDAMLKKPAHGSPEYIAEHGKTGVKFRATTTEEGVNLSDFVPWSEKFDAPDGAKSYLPDWLATAKPGMLKPLSDQVPLEIAEYLVAHFSRFYGDVEYHIEWADNTVNAYAWVQGGKRHVALLGGLIRHEALDTEGIGLVLAHELGHHYGRPDPNHPDGLSCEGEADYFGANIVMRNVWWGPEYVEQMIKGADQLYDLLKNGLVSSLSPEIEKKVLAGSDDCDHPPADCRKETYLAALHGEGKPSCAGPPKAFKVKLIGAFAGAEVNVTTDLPYAAGLSELRECPEELCKALSPRIAEVCKQMGLIGRPVYIEHPEGGYCYCMCR